jgi:adenylate cyclase
MIRQLAAVMFADMTGYTALMQENEAKATMLRNRQREVLDRCVPENNGKNIQYFGDGTLSVFNSSVDAVHAAVQIQQQLQMEPRVSLRIGLHSGDVMYDNENVYGDSVNLASRIEALAVPGSVLVSDKIFDEIKNQSSIKTISLGLFSLKNVKRQVEIFAIACDGLAIPTPAQVGVKAGSEKSIAVLPFINMSADPENEYFSDGISEEILNALTKVEGLRVTARSSSFKFKGQNEDIRHIGSALGVANILSGSVRRAGKRMRVTAQLINTMDGYHIWSEVFDSDIQDVFEVQDEISLKILNRLKENFSPPDQKEQIIKQSTENLEAYNLYLKGNFHRNKSNPEEIYKAIRCFEEAIRLDPKFALAYCAISYSFTWLGSTGLMSPAEAFPKAKDYTLKAIELDPNHAESHLSLASIKFYHNWDFDGAELSLKKAEQLGLNSSLFNQVYGWFLIAKGEFDRAIERMQQATLRDPLSLPLISNLADAYTFANRYDEALEQYNKAAEMDPGFRRAYEGRGMVHLINGEWEKAINDLEKYQTLIGDRLKGLTTLGHAYAVTGQTDKALDCIERLKEREKKEPGTLLYIDYSVIYFGLKDYDKAFYFLNKSYENRMGIACLGMIFCIRYPMMKEMRSDPRFRELTDKMGIIN